MDKLFTIIMEKDDSMEMYNVITNSAASAIDYAYKEFAIGTFQPLDAYDDDGIKYDPVVPNQFELNGRIKTLMVENCMTELSCQDVVTLPEN